MQCNILLILVSKLVNPPDHTKLYPSERLHLSQPDRTEIKTSVLFFNPLFIVRCFSLRPIPRPPSPSCPHLCLLKKQGVPPNILSLVPMQQLHTVTPQNLESGAGLWDQYWERRDSMAFKNCLFILGKARSDKCQIFLLCARVVG